MIAMKGYFRDTIREAWLAKRFWAAQVVVTLVLLLASYAWLRIPDSHTWQLLLSLVVALAIILLFSLLQTVTLSHFHELHSGAATPRMPAHLRRIPLFLFIVIVFIAAEWLAERAQPYVPQTAGYVQHTLPGAARTHTTPQSVDRGMQALANVLQYFLIPLLFLPLLSRISAHGFRGLKPGLWLSRIVHWRWLIFYAVALALGWMLPVYLANKVMKVGGVAAQATSVILRMTLAYVLVITIWICVASALGRLLATSSPNTANRPQV
jgi:hypothetical protein